MEETLTDIPLAGPLKLSLQMAAFRLSNYVDRDALGDPDVDDDLLEILNTAFFVAMCLRAGFEYPEWAQGVIRTMGADAAAAGAIRELIAAMPVSMVSDPEVAP